MRKVSIVLLLIASQLTNVAVSSAASECVSVNVPEVADDGATVTINSIQLVEKTGSNQLTISYQLLNATSDKKLEEGSFKLFFSDNSALPQYGGFGYLFPADVTTRSYTWEFLKSQTPTVIEYNSNFFAAKPTLTKLHWAAINGSCNLGIVPSAAPTPKATPSTPAVINSPSPTGPVSKEVSKVGYDRELLKSRINSLISKNPGKARFLEPLIAQLAFAENVTDGDAFKKAAIVASVAANLNSTIKKFSIGIKETLTCVKGKTKKKVVGINPKCPSGFKISS